MKHFRIAHRLVRRLRAIAPPLIGEQERCYILEILLRKHAAIRDVRIVPEIGSLTVRYDPVALPEQRLLATLFGGVQFELHLLDVQKLLLKLLTAFCDFGQHAGQLLLIAAGGVVQLDQLAALGQRKTDALATQDQLQADLVPA